MISLLNHSIIACKTPCQPINTFSSRYRSTTKASCKSVHSKRLTLFYGEHELNTSYIGDKRPVLIFGQLEPHVRTEHLQVTSRLFVTDTLAANIRLGIELIYSTYWVSSGTSETRHRKVRHLLLSYPRFQRRLTIA